MTPIEIFEHKTRWMPGYKIAIHSDMREAAKAWCENNLEKQSWKHVKYSDVYEDSVHFEFLCDARAFSKLFTTV